MITIFNTQKQKPSQSHTGNNKDSGEHGLSWQGAHCKYIRNLRRSTHLPSIAWHDLRLKQSLISWNHYSTLIRDDVGNGLWTAATLKKKNGFGPVLTFVDYLVRVEHLTILDIPLWNWQLHPENGGLKPAIHSDFDWFWRSCRSIYSKWGTSGPTSHQCGFLFNANPSALGMSTP